MIASRVAMSKSKRRRRQKEAERSHEMKNGPPKAQGSCEAWRSKEKRTPGDRTNLQRGRAVKLGEN